MKISRRGLLKLAGVAGSAAVAGSSRPAHAARGEGLEESALLIDTTRCVGCRGCEVACSEVNALPPPERCGDKAVFDRKRVSDTEHFTLVNRWTDPGDPQKSRFVKTQCMHCVEPACASACLARALDKTPEGPVVYHPERCLGCRYCMVACPFEVPRFEYDKAAPVIRKCQFCFERQKQGKQPACSSVCPSGALEFGKRGELLEAARARVYQNPDKYLPHVYGEHEVGGTNVLYLADMRFKDLGLREDLGDKGYPEYTKGALGVVPFVMTLWPPLLMGLYTFARSRNAEPSRGEAEETND